MALLIIPILFLTGCNFPTSDQATTSVVDLVNFYSITSVDELKEMEMHQSYQLMNDLDLNGEEWIPIGGFDAPFMGNFNGNGYTISNFTITENHLGFNGLFGYVEGNIENLTVNQFVINIEDDFLMNVGGLAGVTYGSVKDVFVEGSIFVKSDFGNIYSGLLVGQAMTDLQDAVVEDELSPNSLKDNQVDGALTVVGTQIVYIGGLVGKSHNVAIEGNLVKDVDIDVSKGSNVFLGGLVGHQFLYDFDTIDTNLDLNKKLITDNIVYVHMSVSELNVLSLGGLVGYSQNTDIMDNAVNLSVNLDADRLNFGLVVGENWIGNVKQNIGILSEYSSLLVPSFMKIVGLSQSELSEINGYFLNNSLITFSESVVDGVEIQTTDLQSDTFYQTNYPDLSVEMIANFKALVTD